MKGLGTSVKAYDVFGEPAACGRLVATEMCCPAILGHPTAMYLRCFGVIFCHLLIKI